MKIAILGAESTGKTALAQSLAAALQARGQRAQWVAEVLREWCEQAQRTPQHHEQAAIAKEQARRLDLASEQGCIIADTTPLMTAIYSELLFNDHSLYDFALAHQRHYDLTLLTALDLPWVADGLQRDGPQVRPRVDELIRAALGRSGLAYTVVHGLGPTRLEHALQAIDHARQRDASVTPGATWRWHCARCSQADCEHRLFAALPKPASVRA